MKIIKKLITWLLLFFPQKLCYFGKPHSVMIETNSNCNLRCPLCPTSTMKRPVGKMNLDQFKSIIDDLAGFVPKVQLWNYGEPFLHPQIFNMIKYAKEKGLHVIVSTNSTKLNLKYRKKIFISGLDELIICLDGFSSETQESYRVGSHFEDIKNNIIALCREKKKGNYFLPKIRLQFVIMKQNENEVEKIKEFAKEIEVDALDLKTVNLWDWGTENQSPKTAKKYIPEKALSRYKFDSNGKPFIIKQDNICTWWLRSSVILWNGDVSICCYDYDGKYVAGNVFKTGSFRNIYKNKKYCELRNGIIKKKLSICRTCQASSDIRLDTNI